MQGSSQAARRASLCVCAGLPVSATHLGPVEVGIDADDVPERAQLRERVELGHEEAKACVIHLYARKTGVVTHGGRKRETGHRGGVGGTAKRVRPV
jgi:hypothetical protein